VLEIMVKIRLIGSLVSYAQTSEITVDTDNPIAVRDLMARMEQRPGTQKLMKMIMDPELNDPRPNVVILINNRDIGTLQGLDSKLHNNDVVTLVPVTHGG
jgi:molybdopterin converting factor small subunit